MHEHRTGPAAAATERSGSTGVLQALGRHDKRPYLTAPIVLRHIPAPVHLYGEALCVSTDNS